MDFTTNRDCLSSESKSDDRLDWCVSLLKQLVERSLPKEWYTTAEFARLTEKAEFTVREWCRLRRVRAEKQRSGRGKHCAWVISHTELERYQREGLLPVPDAFPTRFRR